MSGEPYQIAWNNKLDATRYTDVTAANAESAIRKLRSMYRAEYPKHGDMVIEEVYKI